jgi:PHD/YefM family antitoxin component YafN of YafNO toxin-antitoxin module
MKTVNLEEAKIDLAEAIELARNEPLLLVTPGGDEFLLAEADDFEKEAEALRESVDFQRFLDERSHSPHRIALEELEAETEEELARQREKTAR